MKLERFFDKFELFADAPNAPNAVAKMRELVFELAARGRLIPEALERPVVDDIKLMGDIVELVMGQAPPGDECNTEGHGTIFVKVGEFGTLYPEQTAWTTNPLKFAKRGDVLVCVVGATVGKLNLAIDCAIGRSVAAIRPSSTLDTRFLYYSLMPYTLRLRRNSRGSAQGVIGKAELNAVSLWAPSLAVQKRIVAKVDELMALCDRLEAQQQERDTRHAALARASLARFAEAPTPANLDFLFHKSYTITTADLRKSILTLAVQGKLVPQEPDDELGEDILVAPKKAERHKSKWAGPIEEQETPFQLPFSWKWLRLGDISSLKHGYAFSSEFFTSERAPFVLTTPGNFYEKGGFRDRESKRKYYSGPVDSEFIFKPGDLIIPMTEQAEGLLGSPAFIPDDGRVYIHNQRLGKLSFSEAIAPEFAFWFFNSEFFRGELSRTCTGMKVRHTSPDRILKVPFPVCPLAEQRRIVAKVNQLMALVDQLEAQLAESKAKSAALLEAIVHELLNPSAEVIDLASYRAAIGCYTISKMSQQPYFGRTAAMKTLYLAEAHVGLHLGFQPEREAAGPLDPWLYRFEEEGKQKAWFKAVENTSNGKMKVEYQPGKMLTAQAAQAENLLTQEQRKEFDRLLDLLSGKKTEEVEIIATLFAAWNDFLIDGHAPSDDEIVTEVRENWHERKERFTPAQLRQWLGWLRKNNLVPQGRLPHTVHQSKLTLN